ncbi:MAG TPA: SDR family NAD(P)-dependent oxidoreductase [Pirellulales bacterium]|jgi:NAD(P)-dependent dehydrogenase (short-subunit alcohol dehydrogenase family)
MPDWQGKVVLVTGGSSGLGRAIAAAFAARKARVVIAARGAEALERVAVELRQQGLDVTAIPADLTDQASVESLVAQVIAGFGRLDVLVNNAGRSSRRAVLDTTPEDFQALMDLNLLGVVRLTRAAASHLLSSHGHLVNIGSLAGKSATRYMGAYPASKFALSAYSQQLRLELAPQGLHVLLVCPGPIARDEPRSSHSERAQENVEGIPESARKPGAGVKVTQLRPEDLAERIVRACERRNPELIVPGKARLLFAISALSARWGDWLVRRMTS